MRRFRELWLDGVTDGLVGDMGRHVRELEGRLLDSQDRVEALEARLARRDPTDVRLGSLLARGWRPVLKAHPYTALEDGERRLGRWGWCVYLYAVDRRRHLRWQEQLGGVFATVEGALDDVELRVAGIEASEAG